MLDVCLLGTGGMMPLPGRWLTALFCKYNGVGLLIDVGEGTQIAIKEHGLSSHDIDIICITHFHADHISGLPGLLLSMGNADKTSPLIIIGPKGLRKVVASLRVIAPELPFEIIIKEIGDEGSLLEEVTSGEVMHFTEKGFEIDAFKVMHKVACYGYSISIPRLGKFDIEAAKALEIPVKYWNKLQHGESVSIDGKTYQPEMVMGKARKGIKVTYTTDTRPVDVIIDMAKEADLFICEGMYGDESRDNKAKEYKHMTFQEAATLGKAADPKEMWLTHFSPALVRPQDFIKNAQKIFERVYVGKAGKQRSLSFSED